MIIYKLTNKVNGKAYIGQTKGALRVRVMRHAHYDTCIGRALRKYGIRAFEQEIVIICQNQEELDYYEKGLIAGMKTLMPSGYNLTEGGHHNGAGKHSAITRKKISQALTGKTVPEDIRRKISETQKGRVIPFEVRQKMSKSRMGHVVTEETRNKLRKANTGFRHSALTKNNMSLARMGKSPSEETRRKLSEANKGLVRSEETKRKISDTKKKAASKMGRAAC